jgi:D-3-phosphoglycerate dehydrogenase
MALSCLITENFHPKLQALLEEAGIQCDLKIDSTTQSVMAAIDKYEVLVVNSKILVDKPLIDAAKKLRVVGRVGSGMEIIDADYCAEKGIKVCSAPEGNCDSVGEHALGLLLNVLNNIAKSDREMRAGQWIREENRGETLQGKTVAIIGYGHTGKAFAKLLQGFDCTILAYDVKPVSNPYHFVQMAEWQDIFKNADIVSINVPLSIETSHIANRTFFNSFKKPIYFINTSRGGVCNTADLIEGIKSGKIRGAGLDVFENEKPATFSPQERSVFEELGRRGNVVMTPHIAGWTYQSKFKLAEIMAKKIILLLKNEGD